jgi:hypothetical protein
MKTPRSKSGTATEDRASFFWWEGDTLVINILGKPSAGRDAIGKPKGPQLKVSVTAAPEMGRATDHMVRFLAVQFGVSQSAISVVFGRFNVNKQLRVTAPKILPAVFQQAELF